jgi:hypothetical protein
VLTWWTVLGVFVHLVGKAMPVSLVSRIYFRLNYNLNVYIICDFLFSLNSSDFYLVLSLLIIVTVLAFFKLSYCLYGVSGVCAHSPCSISPDFHSVNLNGGVGGGT